MPGTHQRDFKDLKVFFGLGGLVARRLEARRAAVRRAIVEGWAVLGSNQRPKDYESSALTN